MLLPVYFFSNFVECRGSHLTGFCNNPIRSQLAMSDVLPSSLSSFWLYELTSSGLFSGSISSASNHFATALSISGSLFRKRGFILLRLLRIFSNSTFNNKLGRSLLSATVNILSLGFFIPKYGAVGSSSITYNATGSTLLSQKAADTSICGVLSLGANVSLSDTPFLYFPTVGFYSKLKRFLFFYFTRLVAIPLLGQLDIFL
jgi:hypothetical protein